jgi:hypothetical protein
VLSKDLLGSLEIGQSSLNLTDPRGFDVTKIGQVQIDAPGNKPKVVARITTGTEGQQVKTWGDPATKKANQTLANFVDNAANLRPTEYKAQLKIDSLTPIMKLTYKDERGAKLGSLALYKGEKPGELPEGTELDPANPPRGETEYYIVTEKTRVPGLVRKDTAQRAEQDLKDALSDNPPEEGKKPGGGPNPLGDVPLPPREKTPPADPHGGAPDPHAGAAGSAAAPADPHAGLGGPPAGGSAAAPGAGSAGAGSAAKPAGAGSAAPAAGSAAKPPAAGSAAVAPAVPKPPAAAGSAAH